MVVVGGGPAGAAAAITLARAGTPVLLALAAVGLLGVPAAHLARTRRSRRD